MLKNKTQTKPNIFKYLLAILLASLGLGLFMWIPSSFAQADFCTSLSSEFSNFLDCSSSYSSFTQFEGGLSAPDMTGYDSSLTQAENAKDFVKNITNFALGFLGFIAIIIVIYAGFLYVTSGGDDGKTGQAKNMLTFSLIGFLLIMGAYPIVNTIMQAPGGDGTNIKQSVGVRGAASNKSIGTTNFNSVAQDIKTLTVEVLKDYQNAQDLYSRLNNLASYKPTKMTSRADFVEYLTYMRTALRDMSMSQPLTSNVRVANEMIIELVINPGIQSVQEQMTKEQIKDRADKNFRGSFLSGVSDFASEVRDGFKRFAGDGDNDATLILSFYCALPISERPVDMTLEDCNDASRSRDHDSNLGSSIDAAFDTMITTYVIPAVKEDYKLKMEQNITKLKRLQASINRMRDVNSAESAILSPLNTAFQKASEELDKIKELEQILYSTSTGNTTGVDYFQNLSGGGSDTLKTTAEHIRNAVIKLQELYNLVVNLDFTVPVIVASTTSGSAPLIVTFDASQSYDPSNKSLPNGSFSWDINGDGKPDNEDVGNDANVTCFGNSEARFTNAVITCVFKQPGQYLPSLVATPNKISVSQGEETVDISIVLPGIAYIPINVTAPTSQIELTAQVKDSNTKSFLRKYDENGNIEIDINEFSATLSDAKTKGLEFSAEGTESSDQSGIRKITKYQWSFNDSQTVISGSGKDSEKVEGSSMESKNTTKVLKKFSKRGVYEGILAVTDNEGNTDRKVFTIKITDTVARLQLVNEFAPKVIGTEFIFDASGSKSDVTSDLTYTWSVEGETDFGDPIETDDPEFRYRFTSPGQKTVKLKIEAGSDKNVDETSYSLMIKADKPTAIIDVRYPDKVDQPNLVLLSGAESFSPHEDRENSDENDSKKYGWRVFNAAEGVDFEIIKGKLGSGSSNDNARVTVDSNNEELQLLFKKKGTYQVELTVEAFGEQQTAKANVVINSVVDIKFAEDQGYAFQLGEVGGVLQVKVPVKLTSKNAEKVTVNFGDASKTELLTFKDGKAEVDHVYTRAGTFELTVKAEKGDDSNSAKALISIGGKDSPIAVPKVKMNGVTFANVQELPPVHRGTKITFDASASINNKGQTNSNSLEYTWSFGDGGMSEQAIVPNFRYTDLPPGQDGYFEVTLTVTDKESREKDVKIFKIYIESSKPTLQSLSIKTQEGRTVTPLNVTATVIGGFDKDGEITNYRFYYFPEADKANQMGVKEVSVPSTTLTLNTWGKQNEEVEYGICVDLRDNEGNESKCDELFPNASYPTIKVKNGKNEPPKASFTVDNNRVKVGESILFTSTSVDPDGEIIEWVYDFNDDGSFVGDSVFTEPTALHKFEEKSPKEGLRIRLKVTDNKGATAVSTPVVIYIDGILKEPTASFTEVSQDRTVHFMNTSKVDTENGGKIVKHEWNFNSKSGDPNRIDSTEANPSYEYEASGSYIVRLKITDNEGNVATFQKQVVVQAIDMKKENPFADAELVISNVGANEVSSEHPYSEIIRSNPFRDKETGKILMPTSDRGSVQLSFQHLPMSTKRIFIDQNIYFDTNSGKPGTRADGARNNDIDIEQFDLRSISVEYVNQNKPIRLQVAVEASDGKIYTEQADIIFKKNNLAAALFNPLENPMALAYILFLSLIIGLVSTKFRPEKSSKKLKL